MTPRSAPVRVVNTPLPVSGSVTANLAGYIGLAPDAAVNLGNPASKPVPVRDVDVIGELVRVLFNFSMQDGVEYELKQVYLVPEPASLVSYPLAKITMECKKPSKS